MHFTSALLSVKSILDKEERMSETPIINQKSKIKLGPLKLSPNYVTAGGYTIVLRFFDFKRVVNSIGAGS